MDAMQLGICNAIAMTHDIVLARSDYQLQALNPLQLQGSELQKTITDWVNEHLELQHKGSRYDSRSNSRFIAV